MVIVVEAAKFLEFIVALGVINREGHVDAAEDVVRVGLAVEESLGLIVTLEKNWFYYGQISEHIG